ncbi:MAG TPA: hypothetical protein VG406_23470 [Isosphaeraceae bacterium]|jgi:hypothetical protein|nr:hypothetical protein [Isosphaeraceae bacterium]
MTTDDIVRIILELRGTEAVPELKEQLGYTKVAMGQLNDAFERGEVELSEFIAVAKRLGGEATELGRILDGVAAAEAREADAAAAAARSMAQAAAAASSQVGTYEVLGGTYELVGDALEELANDQAIAARGSAGLAQATTAAATATAAAAATAQQAHGGFHNFGFQVLFASQAIEDFSYGLDQGLAQAFRNTLNNIPLLVMAFGGGPGLAGGISIAAVGASVLVEHWSQLTARFRDSEPAIQADARRLEELGRVTKKTAEETAEFNRLKKEQAQVERAITEIPAAWKKQAQAVQEAYDETGAGEIAEALAANRLGGDEGVTRRIPRAVIDEANAKMAEGRDLRVKADRSRSIGLGALANWNERVAAARESEGAKILRDERARIEAEALAQAKKDLVAAKDDPAALRALLPEIEDHWRDFRGGLAADLTNALPENRRAQRELELQGVERGRQLRERAARRAEDKRNEDATIEAELEGHRRDQADLEAHRRELDRIAREREHRLHPERPPAPPLDESDFQAAERRARERADHEVRVATAVEHDRDLGEQRKRAESREASAKVRGLEGTGFSRDDLADFIGANTGLGDDDSRRAMQRAVTLFGHGVDLATATQAAVIETMQELANIERRLMMMRENLNVMGTLRNQRPTFSR